MADAAAQRRVIDCLSNHTAQLETHPLWMHTVIHASYFMHWRDYLAAYEKKLIPIVLHTCVTTLGLYVANSILRLIPQSRRSLMKRSDLTTTLWVVSGRSSRASCPFQPSSMLLSTCYLASKTLHPRCLQTDTWIPKTSITP